MCVAIAFLASCLSLSLRVRGPSGVQTLALRSDSTLGDLVAAAEAGLGGRLSRNIFID